MSGEQPTPVHSLTLEVVTSVHAGSGAELRAEADFLVQKDGLRVVDLDATLAEAAAGTESLDKALGPQLDLKAIAALVAEPAGYTLPLLAPEAASQPSTLRGAHKDAFNRPLLPGSALKGALRTALLAEALREAPDRYSGQLPYWNTQTRKPGPEPRNPARAFEPVFRGFIRQGKGMPPAPQRDPFRVLKPSDATFANGSLRAAAVRWLGVNNDGRMCWKDMAAKRYVDRWTDAGGDYAEVLPPGTMADVRLSWDTFLLERGQQWTDPEALATLIPTDWADLRARLNAHATHLLAGEAAFFAEHGKDDLAQVSRELRRSLDQKGQAALVRLGWGGGWRTTTGHWLDEDSLAAMRRLYRMGKKGMPFPKTRRLVVGENGPNLLPGWIRLWRPEDAPRAPEPASAGEAWLDAQLQRIQAEHNTDAESALRGRVLAQAWQALDDPALKEAVRETIRARWQARGWWETPQGKAAKAAKRTYSESG